jgi:hypothetical protein
LRDTQKRPAEMRGVFFAQESGRQEVTMNETHSRGKKLVKEGIEGADHDQRLKLRASSREKNSRSSLFINFYRR